MEADSEQLSPEEELTQRHRKERKDLQSKIQALKKTANKSDKKKKREVQEEIVKLELELDKKQEAEMAALKIPAEENKITEELQNVEINNEHLPNNEKLTRITKAQKRRDKKAAGLKERERLIQEQEIENESSVRNAELKKIKEILKELGLMLYEIEADGNCLYNAVDHQLKIKSNLGYGTKQLRLETSNHIRSNSSDYLPFLSNVNTGEMFSDEEFEKYCSNVANTTNWGGQVELRALSHVVKRPITVIQADSPPLIMGEEYKDQDSLIIAYHRYMYRLGEHYNSVQPYVDDTTANF